VINLIIFLKFFLIKHDFDFGNMRLELLSFVKLSLFFLFLSKKVKMRGSMPLLHLHMKLHPEAGWFSLAWLFNSTA